MLRLDKHHTQRNDGSCSEIPWTSIGVFLILGLKAGLYANQLLGKDYFKTNVVVKTEVTPPCSCFLDGVQFSTGCTMGKGNIQLKKDSSLSVIFTKGDRKLELYLKSEILRKLKEEMSKRECEKIAIDYSKKDVKDLFHLSVPFNRFTPAKLRNKYAVTVNKSSM